MARIYRPRRTLRRKRPFIRRRRIMRRPRLTKRALLTHHFKRTFTLGTVSASAAGPVFGATTFNLAQLPNSTEFTNLFDMYRINKVVIKFVPNHNSSDLATANQNIPNFHSILDYTDATAPASLSSMYEYANWKMSRGTSIHKRVFTPASLDFVNATAGANAGNPTWKQWISTTAPTIEHYAIKYALEQAVINAAVEFVPYVTMYFSCKSVK